MSYMRRVGSLALRMVPGRGRAAAMSTNLPAALHSDIKLLVCDMAGTTVEEAGLVYTTLQKCMVAAGLDVTMEDGADKSEVSCCDTNS